MDNAVYPSVTEKRNWLARDKLHSVLMGLGLPASLDSTHLVIKHVDEIAWWLVASKDTSLGGMLGAPPEAMSAFDEACGPLSVNHIVAPGISFRGPRPELDGVAMRIRFATRNANEGPEAFIVPVARQMLNSGAEWNTHVALVPRKSLNDWMALSRAARMAARATQARSMTLKCFNGSDERIQPMKIDDIIMDADLKSSIVDDVKGFLSMRSSYTSRGLPWTRKYLLNGPPGTGKTSLARWMATELGLPAVTFDFTDRWADGRTFKRFLGWAGRQSPSIVILDDFEKVMASENRTGITNHTMLTSLSGMGNLDGLIFVITSNSTRPFRGPMRRRFDVVKEIPLPGWRERKEYLTKMLINDGVSVDYVDNMVSQTDGWSFDDLRGVIAAALGSSVNSGRINEASLAKGLTTMRARRTDESSVDVAVKAVGNVGTSDGHTHRYDNDTGETEESDGHTHTVAVGASETGETDGHTHTIPNNLRREG